jgi:hypothetical protein
MPHEWNANFTPLKTLPGPDWQKTFADFEKREAKKREWRLGTRW